MVKTAESLRESPIKQQIPAKGKSFCSIGSGPRLPLLGTPHYLGFSLQSDNTATTSAGTTDLQNIPFPSNFDKIVVARNFPENSLLLLEADPFTENHSGELHHIRICLKGIKG